MATLEYLKSLILTGERIAKNNPGAFVVGMTEWKSVRCLTATTRFLFENRYFNFSLSLELGDGSFTEEIYLSDINKRSSLDDDARYRLSVSLDLEDGRGKLIELAEEFGDEGKRVLELMSNSYEECADGVYYFTDNYAETSMSPERAMGILISAGVFWAPREGATLEQYKSEMEKRQARFRLT